jgi:uncharacterized protein (DUF1684 family)
MNRSCLLLAVTVLGIATVHATDTDTYTHSIEQWRAARVERLTAPDGWLSLVGLPWLEHGANTLGSAADNAIVIPGAPAHLGTVTWNDDGSVAIALTADSGASIDGTNASTAVLLDDGHEQPTVVRFGSTSFYLVDRNGRKGLRIKNPEAPTRAHFQGIDYFPIDPSWRIQAKWIPAKPGETLQMGTAIGTIDTFPVPGKAVFERDGKTLAILPVIEVPGDAQYFVVFADRTSGKETYGAARFLYIDPPKDGTVVLDFNQAYNPPCAFTPFATCPLAPPENRLDVRVTAGEKKYAGGHD